MEAIDKNIRALYVLAAEDDWSQFRAHGLEHACQVLGAGAGAWLTQPDDQGNDSELTVQPASLDVTSAQMQALSFTGKGEVELQGPAMRGFRHGIAFRYQHHD